MESHALLALEKPQLFVIFPLWVRHYPHIWAQQVWGGYTLYNFNRSGLQLTASYSKFTFFNVYTWVLALNVKSKTINMEKRYQISPQASHLQKQIIFWDHAPNKLYGLVLISLCI